ncbi:MAG: hypothetical protein JO235_14130 [Chroococcidiopsidaceae cyanobacterium CP_BM_RX_35]|nr:hypothetical protein [Chroococcidiopsidaceae cyanobacterium CP_BM_RX_35]
MPLQFQNRLFGGLSVHLGAGALLAPDFSVLAGGDSGELADLLAVLRKASRQTLAPILLAAQSTQLQKFI